MENMTKSVGFSVKTEGNQSGRLKRVGVWQMAMFVG